MVRFFPEGLEVFSDDVFRILGHQALNCDKQDPLKWHLGRLLQPIDDRLEHKALETYSSGHPSTRQGISRRLYLIEFQVGKVFIKAHMIQPVKWVP